MEYCWWPKNEVTWAIDYEGEDLEYFAGQLKAHNPDIVCLQESHTNSERSIAAELAALLGYGYVYNQPMSPSHVDAAFQLGTAILSKWPLEPSGTFNVPYPSFPLFFSDGRPAIVHEKGVQTFKLGDIMIANMQLLPIALFGAQYDDGADGTALARSIELSLLEYLRTPLIFAGDFNFDTPQTVYANLYKTLSLHEALPSELTRPNKEGMKKTPDHLLYSDGLTLVDSKVVPVHADHYLCVATFKRA